MFFLLSVIFQCDGSRFPTTNPKQFTRPKCQNEILSITFKISRKVVLGVIIL